MLGAEIRYAGYEGEQGRSRKSLDGKGELDIEIGIERY